MKIQDLVYQLYAIQHKYGNLPVGVLNKDLGALALGALSTVDLKGSDGIIRKVLLLQDEFTARKALAQSEKTIEGLINPEPLATSNIVDIATRKRVLE